MPIKTTAAALLLLAACADDVELNPLPPLSKSQDSTICQIRKYLCDPYDPEANWRCDTICGYPGHCLAYNTAELRLCERYPGQYIGGGYCNPFGEPTWPTHCVEGAAP